jgi:DNA-binding transcriptional regulator WhiA
MSWFDKAKEMYIPGEFGYRQIAKALNKSVKTVESRFLREKKKGIIFEDKREFAPEDIDYYFEKMLELQEAQDKLDTKQVKASIRIDDNKPIAVAYWSDWHIGSKGVDYKAFQHDLELIRDTEGLYFIGGGDYKDNYISGTHTGGNFEQIIQPGMQDIVVQRQMEKVAEKCLALVRGCFLAGTPITMADGTRKPIEAITEGDEVITNIGNIRKVNKKFINFYNGEMVRFETMGNIGSVTATRDHKVLCIRKEDIKCKARDRICKPFSINKNWCTNRSCKGIYGNNSLIEWIEIGDLQVGDFLLMPKAKNRYSSIPDELMYVYGLFLAEGSFLNNGAHKDGIDFTFSIEEMNYAKKVRDVIKKYFGKEASVTIRGEKNIITVRIYSRELANTFYEMCGEYSHSKKANEILVNSHNSLFLVAGMLDGDGHQRRGKKKDATITTISEDLAYQLRHIMNAHGIPCTLRQQIRKNREYNDYQINIRASRLEKLERISHKARSYQYKHEPEYIFNIGDYIATPIKTMEIFNYCGETHDFEVDTDHSYLVNGICAHNCHDSWDKKQGDKDFLATLCEITNSVNMWHGGEITLKLGDQNYLWRVRHKYPGQSKINFENAMRRLIETQGPCDVAAEAHLHNEYSMHRHINGRYTILLRGGSYKIWDEHAQQMAGYKGKEGVPVVIMYADKHHIVNFNTLEDAIIHLKALRN